MKTITFSSPVDASHFSAGLGTAAGAALLSIDYEQNVYRFQLIGQDGSRSVNAFGVNVTLADESTAAADIRAAIAATIP